MFPGAPGRPTTMRQTTRCTSLRVILQPSGVFLSESSWTRRSRPHRPGSGDLTGAAEVNSIPTSSSGGHGTGRFTPTPAAAVASGTTTPSPTQPPTWESIPRPPIQRSTRWSTATPSTHTMGATAFAPGTRLMMEAGPPPTTPAFPEYLTATRPLYAKAMAPTFRVAAARSPTAASLPGEPRQVPFPGSIRSRR